MSPASTPSPSPSRRLLPPGFQLVHGPEAIAAAVERLAAHVRSRHGQREVLMVAVLDGALVFAADLLRHLAMPTRLATIKASSYRGDTRSPGALRVLPGLPEVAGRHVVLVDDIVDTGHTLARIQNLLHAGQPASLDTLVLLDKPSGRQVQVQVDAVGLQVPDRFVVGYGLDDNGLYRNLPCIAATTPEPR